MSATPDFLAENNLCGQSVLRLVSRGNAIIAEILRLKDFIPKVFANEQNKYNEIIIDFRYFNEQDAFNGKINGSSMLQDLDEELRENYLEILTRFYSAFESVHKYITDLNQFLHDLEEGFYIQQSLETVILDDEGKQLLCEALYLYGVMLIMVDLYIEGPVREKILVAYYRYSAQRAHSDSKLDEVCHLLRSTGYLKTQPSKRPSNYPEDYFRRVKVNADFVEMVIGRLRSDDLYHQIAAQPLPEHRSTALAQQAAMLVVCLSFAPDILHNQTAKMREIVDKFFPDNWVITIYMGLVVNLVEAWEPYKAARLALSNTVQNSNVKECSVKQKSLLEKLVPESRNLLKEGVLTEDFLLDNMQKVMNLVRQSNVTLRWMLLHTNALTPGAESMKRCRQLRDQVLQDCKFSPLVVFRLLLYTAEIELQVREMYRHLLSEKKSTWQKCKQECVERLIELADVFSGTKPLTRVERNENLQSWLREISQQIEALSYEDGTASGRKMVQLIQALEEVQEFHQLETQLQIKQFLTETRRLLHHMIRIANIREDFLITLQIVSDLSYAWLIIESYTQHMQDAIQKDPTLVERLRATFLKLSSALDLPLLRINQARSADLVSVSQYYSTELVSYIRHVLHVIPHSMFGLLEQIVKIQTDLLKEIPTRLDKDKLREHAQLEQRFQVAKLTESVSTLTSGILAMKTTLVGIVRLDPKLLLEDGIRRELVQRVALALHTSLQFQNKAKNSDLPKKLQNLGDTMEGFRKSFEYIQDYVRIQGLRMFQEETARVIGYNVEQECNTFQRNQVQDWQSSFQSKSVPIPQFPPTDTQSATFIGRLAREIIRITDPKNTVFVEQNTTWYDSRQQVVLVTPTLFSQLKVALGTCGLVGLDTLFAYMIASQIQVMITTLQKDVFKDQNALESLAAFAHVTSPPSTVLGQPVKTYGTYVSRFQKSWSGVLDCCLRVGQLQLLRQSCAFQLRLASTFESSLLSSALATLNKSLLNDLVHRESIPDTALLPEVSQYLQWAGLHEPLKKMYTSTQNADLPYFSQFFALFVIGQLYKFSYAKNLDCLVAKRPQDNVDGIPFVLGLSTILRHVGTTPTKEFAAVLVQSAKSYLENAVRNGTMELPHETSTVLALLEQCQRWNLFQGRFLYSLMDEGVWSLYKTSVP